MEKRTPKQSAQGRSTEKSESQGVGNALHELFLDELGDIYNAEQQSIKALPKMAKAAKSNELRQALELHFEETRQQIARLEEAAETLGTTIRHKKCKAMEGLIEEARELLEEQMDSAALDAAIIAAAQKIEHYEIASYGTVCAWAEQMGHDEVVDLLRETLDEEEAADEKLTSLAETIANPQASESE